MDFCNEKKFNVFSIRNSYFWNRRLREGWWGKRWREGGWEGRLEKWEEGRKVWGRKR